MSALGNIGRRLIETVEARTGREIVPAGQTQLLESISSDNRVINKTLEFIGFTLMSMQSVPQLGRMPSDVAPVVRVASAALGQRAWVEDPMAGQYVDLYVSFVFGRGVPKARAHDDDVQDVLDECWDDAANKRILTSFDKLVEKGVDLCIQCNVFFRVFDDGQDGMARLSLLTFEDVLDVVRHPLDKYRVLYYKVRERPVNYDYSKHAYVAPLGDAGKPRIVYIEADGAYDDDNPVMVAQDDAAGGRAALAPPANLLRPGRVIHLAVNKTSDMAFGVPRMRRLLRWWTAYNEVLEGHVNRMKAMASIYMKFTAQGATDKDLDRLGRMAIGGRPSALGQSQAVGALPVVPGPQVMGGVLGQNEGANFEPFKIDSGASDLADSVPQLRAQASGIFPPTYYGQDSGALAGAQSVELPVLKFIERDQEAWASVFHRLGQARIDAAIAVGDLDEWRDPTPGELAQIDAAAAAGEPEPFDLEGGRIRRDLTFEVNMPSPLKRAMGDLVTAAVATAVAVDPNGANAELSRWLFGFILAEAFDVEDPQRVVDMVLPRHVAQALAAGGTIDPATGLPRPPAPDGTQTVTGPDGQQHPVDNPGGAPVSAPNPEDRKVQEAAPQRRRDGGRASQRRLRAVDAAFTEDVEDIVAQHLQRLADLPAAANGNGTP